MGETEATGTGSAFVDAILWFFGGIFGSFYDLAYAITHPGLWLNWADKEAIMRFVYYGGSIEFFFVVFTFVLVLTAVGLWRNSFMWGCVRVMEGFANITGRLFAWAGLIMVLQQIIIVFVQRIFVRPDISFGFGIPLTYDISWWAEALKFHNALVIALCCTYTFVQGGHVRVDLVYAAVKYRTQKLIDMIGCVIFMAPMAVLVWMYGWYFMWRHLITPKPSASESLDRLMMKARAVRWNVETIGFSPNGFNGYFLFKVLMVAFAGMVFIHSVAFFYRSYLEWKEGPESEGKYLDKDSLGEGEEAYEGTH